MNKEELEQMRKKVDSTTLEVCRLALHKDKGKEYYQGWYDACQLAINMIKMVNFNISAMKEIHNALLIVVIEHMNEDE